MDLVAAIVEQARSDYEKPMRSTRADDNFCPIEYPSRHPIKDCALPVLREAYDFASLPKTDALEIALHLMGYIQSGI
jgi:hypothetical protein